MWSDATEAARRTLFAALLIALGCSDGPSPSSGVSADSLDSITSAEAPDGSPGAGADDSPSRGDIQGRETDTPPSRESDTDGAGCVPQCQDRECGGDGCGGTCAPGCGPEEECFTTGECYGPPTGCGSECPEMVQVPAGPFWLGCNKAVEKKCGYNEVPQHEVTLSDYRIDGTEVTVGAWQKCVAAKACTSGEAKSSKCNWGQKGRQHHPMNCVTWDDATAYCAWAGKRLCTEAEWEKAAKGGCEKYPDQECRVAMPIYPWGNAKSNCTYAIMNDGSSGCGADSTWEVGSRPAGASPYGALDMSGNVEEWVSDRYVSPYDLSSSIDPQGPPAGSSRVTRGGGWFGYGADWVRASARSPTPPHSAHGALGVRCCASGL